LNDNDLVDILLADGLSISTVPTMTAYELLYVEAARRLVGLLVADHGMPVDQADAELARLDRQKRQTLQTLSDSHIS
jgi:hypothetical protein